MQGVGIVLHTQRWLLLGSITHALREKSNETDTGSCFLLQTAVKGEGWWGL